MPITQTSKPMLDATSTPDDKHQQGSSPHIPLNRPSSPFSPFTENEDILLASTEFTDESKAMATLVATLLHQDEPNHIKLEIIKEALQTGQYQIHADHIAHQLLEFAPAFEESVV